MGFLQNVAIEYFRVVEDYLLANMPLEWEILCAEYAIGRAGFSQGKWAQSLWREEPRSLVIASASGRYHEPTYRAAMYGLGELMASFWMSKGQELRDHFNTAPGTYLFVPYQEVDRPDLLSLGRIYFDLVIMEDPLPRLKSLRAYHDAVLSPLRLRPLDRNAQRTINTGLDVQLVENLFFFWSMWKKKELFFREVPHYAIASSLGTTQSTRVLALDNEPAGKLALRYLSTVAGEELPDSQSLQTVSRDKGIPWAKLVSEDRTLRGVLRLAEDGGPDDVRWIAAALLITYGLGEKLANAALHDEKAHPAIALAIYANLQNITASTLECHWDSSGLNAIATIDRDDWAYNEWLVREGSGATLPPNAVAANAVSFLALQTERLSFLRDLDETEVMFLRAPERLREIREVLGKCQLACRADTLVTSDSLARTASSFLIHLDEYEDALEEVACHETSSLAPYVVRRIEEKVGEVGLSTSIGLGGMLLSAPWSTVLGVLGLVLGGESARGILSGAWEDREADRAKVRNLKLSALSVCVSARSRLLEQEGGDKANQPSR